MIVRKMWIMMMKIMMKMMTCNIVMHIVKLLTARGMMVMVMMMIIIMMLMIIRKMVLAFRNNRGLLQLKGMVS